MKHKHVTHTARWKATGLSVVFFVAGIVLIILSNQVISPADRAGAGGTTPASAPAASAPATSAPATAPAAPKGRGPSPAEQSKAARENMSSMLLLIGLLGIAFGAVCAGWAIYDVYRSRPAWKTQTKYPRRR